MCAAQPRVWSEHIVHSRPSRMSAGTHRGSGSGGRRRRLLVLRQLLVEGAAQMRKSLPVFFFVFEDGLLQFLEHVVICIHR